MNAEDPLSQLRDIHTVAAPGLWPPAPGWWLSAALLILAGYFLLRWLLRRRRRGAPIRTAKVLLESVWAQYQANQNPQDLVVGLSRLLRRVAVHVHADAAGLHGQQWLAFLDRTGGEENFSTGPGKILADAPYRQITDDELDAASLIASCRHWIGHQQGRQSAD